MDAAARLCAAGVLVAGTYGALTQHDAATMLLALAFAIAYAAALRCPRSLLLIGSLLALSLALHVRYLPAGVCCFGALMLARFDFRRPVKPAPKPVAKRE